MNNFTKKIKNLNLLKEQALKKAFSIGFENEKYKHSCCQACFNAVAETVNIKNPLIFKCVSALGGGGAGTCEGTCGAFSAGLIVFSFFYGRTYNKWLESKQDRTAALLGAKLYRIFFGEYGSIICKDIQIKNFGRSFNFNEMSDKDFRIFEELGGHSSICPNVVGLSASSIIDILWEN